MKELFSDTIRSIGNHIVTKIMDNGKGIGNAVSVRSSKSLGLRTMHERITTLGGKLKIEANVPTGTVLTFSIPKTT